MCFVWVSTQPWHSATSCNATRRHRLATRRAVVDRDDDVGRRGAVVGQPGIQRRPRSRPRSRDRCRWGSLDDGSRCGVFPSGRASTTRHGARSVGGTAGGEIACRCSAVDRREPAGGAPAVTGAAAQRSRRDARGDQRPERDVRGEGARRRGADPRRGPAERRRGGLRRGLHRGRRRLRPRAPRVRAGLAPCCPTASTRSSCADAPDWGSAATSVFGIIRGGALAQGYAAEDFPPIDEPIRLFVGGARRQGRRGAVGVRAAERAGGPPAVRAAAAPGVRAAGRRPGDLRGAADARAPSGRTRAPSRSSSSSRASGTRSTTGSPCGWCSRPSTGWPRRRR